MVNNHRTFTTTIEMRAYLGSIYSQNNVVQKFQFELEIGNFRQGNWNKLAFLLIHEGNMLVWLNYCSRWGLVDKEHHLVTLLDFYLETITSKMVMWHTLMWHMLLGAKDDLGHKLNATGARSLDILQCILTKKHCNYCNRRGVSLKIVEFNLESNVPMLYIVFASMRVSNMFRQPVTMLFLLLKLEL